MADAITRQVSEEPWRWRALPSRPLKGNPQQPKGGPSFRLMEHGREVAPSDRSDRLPLGRQGRRAAEEPVARSAQGKTAISATASTPYASHFRRTAGPRFLRQEQTPAPPSPRDEECSTEVVATIAGVYVEEITRTLNLEAHSKCSLSSRDLAFRSPRWCSGEKTPGGFLPLITALWWSRANAIVR
ncbi:hypothetical protein Cgig2_027367 [Carnegiea gigantea]|uniref:Uncharacterized protein n=1 Tax=Carnegiea gigantea TaxID=171969 RepID=A0A9Q1JHG8_9CARY|nr:hypothetical protein Cgig2_027367 [Carnegiea gigantea]